MDVLFIFLEGAGRVFLQYLADLFARSLSVSPSDRGLTSKISLIALRGVTFVLDDPDNQTTRPSLPLLGRQLRPHQRWVICVVVWSERDKSCAGWALLLLLKDCCLPCSEPLFQCVVSCLFASLSLSFLPLSVCAGGELEAGERQKNKKIRHDEVKLNILAGDVISP